MLGIRGAEDGYLGVEEGVHGEGVHSTRGINVNCELRIASNLQVGGEGAAGGVGDEELVVEKGHSATRVPQPQPLPGAVQFGCQVAPQGKGQHHVAALGRGVERQPVLDPVGAVLVPLGHSPVPAVLHPLSAAAQAGLVDGHREGLFPVGEQVEPHVPQASSVSVVAGGGKAAGGEGKGEVVGAVGGTVGPRPVAGLPCELVLGGPHQVLHRVPLAGGELLEHIGQFPRRGSRLGGRSFLVRRMQSTRLDVGGGDRHGRDLLHAGRGGGEEGSHSHHHCQDHQGAHEDAADDWFVVLCVHEDLLQDVELGPPA